MRLLLDTSPYSGFMRGHAEILSRFQGADEIFLNSVVIDELIAGFIKGGRRRKKENELRKFLRFHASGDFGCDRGNRLKDTP